MIYVDAPTWTTGAKKPRQSYAHMVADTHDELHAFAAKIGVKPHFFHKTPRMFHYDINKDQHVIAVAHGAIEVETKKLLPIAKKAMQ